MKGISFHPLGDQAIMIDFGHKITLKKNQLILSWYHSIKSNPFPGFVEAVPAYTTLTIFYDPVLVGTNFPYQSVKKILEKMPLQSTYKMNSQTIQIPVCYEPPFSIDLSFVARHNGMTEKEVVEFHSNRIYHVHFIGFAPGFPFLSGMDEKIAAPRRTSPRLRIPKGSVGIAGSQTGIYPLETPGGWQIIGRTPLNIFNLNEEPPTLINHGDKVQFIPISKNEFTKWEVNEWQ